MEDQLLKKSEILEELDYYYKQDYTYKSGRILGSMCTEPHPFAKEIFIKFLNSNLGDPGLFPGTKTIEDKAVRMLGDLLGGDNVVGNIVTGGTEANLMAMRGARNIARLKGIKDGEILVPESAHFSFKKAEDILGLKLVQCPLDEDYKISTDFVQDNITKDTVAIVGVAGSTELGKVDPIPVLSDIAVDKDVHLHVDAAFGGFVIPFLRKYGYEFPDFDFSLEGVDSMTVDPHKMGLVPIPSGCVLFRDSDVLKNMEVDTPYLTYKTQSTIVGTRLGASSAAVYGLFKYLGFEGYGKLALECMDNTLFLRDELVKLGYSVVSEPELNIVGFNYPGVDTSVLANILSDYGWLVSESSIPKAIRIIMMRHIKRENIIDLVKDLKNIKKTIDNL